MHERKEGFFLEYPRKEIGKGLYFLYQVIWTQEPQFLSLLGYLRTNFKEGGVNTHRILELYNYPSLVEETWLEEPMVL